MSLRSSMVNQRFRKPSVCCGRGCTGSAEAGPGAPHPAPHMAGTPGCPALGQEPGLGAGPGLRARGVLRVLLPGPQSTRVPGGGACAAAKWGHAEALAGGVAATPGSPGPTQPLVPKAQPCRGAWASRAPEWTYLGPRLLHVAFLKVVPGELRHQLGQNPLRLGPGGGTAPRAPLPSCPCSLPSQPPTRPSRDLRPARGRGLLGSTWALSQHPTHRPRPGPTSPSPGSEAAAATHVCVAGPREGHLQVVEAGSTERVEPVHHLLGVRGWVWGVGRGYRPPHPSAPGPVPTVRLAGCGGHRHKGGSGLLGGTPTKAPAGTPDPQAVKAGGGGLGLPSKPPAAGQRAASLLSGWAIFMT